MRLVCFHLILYNIVLKGFSYSFHAFWPYLLHVCRFHLRRRKKNWMRWYVVLSYVSRSHFFICKLILILIVQVSIPAWFTVDTRLGSLSVHLDTPQCFSAEMYSADLCIVGKPEDDKVFTFTIIFYCFLWTRSAWSCSSSLYRVWFIPNNIHIYKYSYVNEEWFSPYFYFFYFYTYCGLLLLSPDRCSL